MKSMSKSSRSAVQLRPHIPAARSAVAIAVTPQRTNVSIPNTSEALLATGALLFAAGVLIAALEE